MTFTVRIPQLGAQGPAGNLIIEKTNVAPGAEDGAIGDMAVRFDDSGDVLLYPKKTSSGWPAGRSIQGPQGTAGWSPIIATVVGPSSAILRLIDWVGGAGDKPAGAGKYISAAGLVDDPDDAAPFGFSGLAKNILYDAAESGISAGTVQQAIDLLVADLCWYAIPPGYVIYRPVGAAAAPPQDHPDLVFVELTAGKTGSGQYNEGKLVSESVSGTAPLIVAEAVVDVVGSPLYGVTIPLLNTERSIQRPGDVTPGDLQQDQIQDHGHQSWEGPAATNGDSGSNNAYPATRVAGSNSRITSPSFYNTVQVRGITTPPGFGEARTGNETRGKNRAVIAYMKVK